MDILGEYGTILLVLAIIFGFFMAWGIGANDVANAMGTSVGSGAITLKQAILIAAIFEFAGAFLAGGQVTSTIRKGIVDPALLAGTPELLVYGMISALLAAAVWLFIASMKGWPVSTTHSIVGAIVGFAAVGIGVDSVSWLKVGTIVMSWVVSPVMAGVFAFIIYRSVHILILDTDKPLDNARRYIPIYMFLVGFMISMVTFLKGLSHVGLDISFVEAMAASAAVGLFVMTIGMYMQSKMEPHIDEDHELHLSRVEKVFATLMIFTACSMAFAHGSNDVANAIGPLAAVNAIVRSGEVTQEAIMPLWILFLGGIGIIVGLITYGHKVMATIGRKITHLTPTLGFSAELSAATTVVIASATGIPISTTHTLVGAVLGVGLARAGSKAIDKGVIKRVFISWIVTLPAGAILAITFFYILKYIFGGG
ncbi:MAG: phosphate permease [SAR86 cluster bacterium]|uniref:Phosphate transporter n=1 Tax=SAR86 cluster bacterium TaxID=2030880 RepID=A0A2A5CE45_9GAMM|nr:inorganic phosphate transporter [Gammaproteobacteria bacterium AH-315-E17]PCJ41775.1 MAG: phosphate permease [SAR86 cluster bacterium]